VGVVGVWGHSLRSTFHRLHLLRLWTPTILYYIFKTYVGIMHQDNSEQVVIDPLLIAKHYIRTWFFLDLLSSIPLDYIFLIFSSGSDVSSTLDHF
jgi:hypothetical protein